MEGLIFEFDKVPLFAPVLSIGITEAALLVNDRINDVTAYLVFIE